MITISQTYGGNFLIPPPIPSSRRLGVPPGGPADPRLADLLASFELSNSLIEIISPLQLVSDCPTTLAIAAYPGDHPSPDHPAASIALIPLNSGQKFTLKAPTKSFRYAISWPGMTCSSRLPLALEPGQTLPCQTQKNPRLLTFDPTLIAIPKLMMPYLPTGDPQVITAKVEPAISRVGTRLQPQRPMVIPEPLHRSEPSLPGAIQITPDGTLLIHGPDGPTLGGYPKIGVIANAALADFSQLRPGQTVTLTPITRQQANHLIARHQAENDRIHERLRRALTIARLQP